jgi:hypothetical protein
MDQPVAAAEPIQLSEISPLATNHSEPAKFLTNLGSKRALRLNADERGADLNVVTKNGRRDCD